MSITWIFLCPRFGQECLKILFLTHKLVLHGYFHVPVLIKNVWNYLLFFAHKWVLHEYFHVPVLIKKCLILMSIMCTWKIPWTRFGQGCLKRFFTRKWYYMEITMDLFGEALLYWDRKYRWQVFLSQKFIDFLIA